MKEPPETFKFAEALFEFRRELFDGQLHVFRNRAGVAGDIFAAFKVRRNKEGAARNDLTGFELTAAFFERGDEPLERMDRIVEHFRRIACLDEFAVLEEFAADGIEAGNCERLAVNGRAVNDSAADGAVGNHQVFVERREPSFKAGVRNFNAAGDGDVFKKLFVAHAARQIHLGDH